MKRSPLRISAPEDLLALVPCVLGFHPDDSLVLVVLAGEGGNVHARVDLTLDDDGVRAGVAGLMTAVARTEARLVGVIAYTDDPVLADDALDLLFDQLIDSGVDWAFAIRADGERWFNLDCDDVCCPPTGEPYDVSAHPITAQFVLDGHVTFPSRADLADSLIGTDVDDVEAVQAAADEALRRFRSAASGPLGASQPEATRRHLVAEGHWVRARVRHFLASREPLDVDDAGRMAVALVNVEVRDVAWAQMTRDNAEVHVELWRGLVRRTPPDLLAAPAALLGFAAWLAGDGALAWCAVERCQQAEPGYSMADLLTQALVAAVPPTAWTPIPGDALPLFAG
jgi:hypothetical protein